YLRRAYSRRPVQVQTVHHAAITSVFKMSVWFGGSSPSLDCSTAARLSTGNLPERFTPDIWWTAANWSRAANIRPKRRMYTYALRLDRYDLVKRALMAGQLVYQVLARIGAMRFFSPLAVRDQMLKLANTDPALLRYRATMQSAPFAMGLRYEGLRMVKSMMADRMSVEMMAQTRDTLLIDRKST